MRCEGWNETGESVETAFAFTSARLHLVLLPTERCNFRCHYCYEKFLTDAMERKVVRAIRNLITARGPTLRDLSISWFGGEPLLEKRTVYELAAFVHSLSSAYPELSTRSNMTTNGSLLDQRTFLQLVELGVTEFQITLDGPKESHDRVRVTADGKGSFAAIWGNLIDISDTDADAMVILRIHYAPDTWENLTPLLEDIQCSFGDDARFKLAFKPIEQFGSPNDDRMCTFRTPDKERIGEILRKSVAIGAMVLDPREIAPNVCYASQPNSFVIRPDATLSKCTVGLYDDVNNVGRLLPNGTLQLDLSHLRFWIAGFETGDPQQLACPLSALRSGWGSKREG
jgi:uncharacterized protein